MSFNHFYQSELAALRTLGRQFAERNPALARFLGEGGQDPDVERLLEGFAFLTGRLRQKLDDELPELTHSLMHLLWPNYMRPLPSFGMLQFEPLRQAAPITVPRETSVESKAINGVRCRFQTCYETEVSALQLVALDCVATGEGTVMQLRLAMTCDGHFGELGLKRLRFHLAGERYVSQALYLHLLRHLDRIELVPLGADHQPIDLGMCCTLAASQLAPVGFAEDESLIPYPVNTFRGYRYLQEYFAFQDKFLFVDLSGLDVLGAVPGTQSEQVRGLEIRFAMSVTVMESCRPGLDNLKLYCTPVANLFKHEAVPVRLDGKQDEYLVLPAEFEPRTCGVFSVDTVVGWLPGGSGYRPYVPFESFVHDPGQEPSQGSPCYSVRQRPASAHGAMDTYLGFGPARGSQDETLSIELTCTNLDLPSALAQGDICLPTEETPAFLRFGNIGLATPSYAPPLDRGFLWKLISNMSLNYLSLADVEVLKAILETYDLPRYHDRHAEKVSKRLLDGLVAIRPAYVDRLHRGLPLRGVATELTIDPEGYRGEGDLFVFASVLNEFLALYASLNSFHELTVISKRGGVYQWSPRMGQQPLL